MGRPIQKITIVGGGTAGWLAAAMLNHRLQWGYGHLDGVRITLIESPDTPTIGVGESTLPGIKQTLEFLEISEAEFVTRTHATFKMGVQLDGWHDPNGRRRKSFYHPLTGGVQVAGRNPGGSLLAYGVPQEFGLEDEYGNLVGHALAAVAANLAPRHPQQAPYDGTLGYAYHVDAGQLALFLREIATARGVEHVLDHVVGVNRTERGLIKSLQLKAGGAHEVELVIDCSGFRGLLINEALGEPFESFADYLPNDRGTALQVSHKPGERLTPATIATALDNGWRWRIPLQSRLGTGYVWSSAFTTEERAIDELVSSLPGYDHLMTPKTLKMRVGRCKRSWVGNCVAIGLSGGFVEPLEATAIHFIDLACRRLLQSLPSTDFEEAVADKFNVQMARHYDEVRDFLSLHFTLGDREDTPYWRALRHEVKRSDFLEECLAIWRHSLPDDYDPWHANIFGLWSVTNVLLGKGFYPGPLPSAADTLPEAEWRAFLQQVKDVRVRLLSKLPPVEVALQIMAKSHRPGESAAHQPQHRSRATQNIALGPSAHVMSPPNIAAMPAQSKKPVPLPSFQRF